MLLFYLLRDCAAHQQKPSFIWFHFANCHWSFSLTPRNAHFALHNAADDVISGDTRHREVPCITMGLCIIRRNKREAPINKESVAMRHA